MQFPIIPAHAMTVHVCRRACHSHAGTCAFNSDPRGQLLRIVAL